MDKYMYTDKEGYSIFIVTDREFLSHPCRESEPGTTLDKIVNQLITMAWRLDTCRERVGCLGLAANQLGYNERVIVLKIKGKYKPFINPVIIERCGIQTTSETCFSRPGKSPIQVERSTEVKVATKNNKGIKLYGMAAIACQHVLDHLNGVLI